MAEQLASSSQQTIEQLQARIAELEGQLAQLQAQTDDGHSLAFERASYAPLLGMLLEISAALRITHDVPTVLELIEQKVPLLFNASTRVLIFLADEKQNLVLRTLTAADEKIILEPGKGIAGRGYLAPRAMLFAGPILKDALADLSDEQQQVFRELFNKAWPPTSAIAASLRVHEQLVGVLVLHTTLEHAPFSTFELPFVQALADLAAVAIVDAQQRADLNHIRDMHARAQAQLDNAQIQLLQSARLAAVGELSASVAHEINNPLYAARNSLFLATRKLPADSDALEYVQLAQDELGRIARIISRMRDFYRPTREELAPTDINQLLEETLALVQTHLRHGHVQVEFLPDTQLPPLIVSADQIRQVMLNLILNACDAMSARGGTLTVQSMAVDGRLPKGAPPVPNVGVSHFATEVLVSIRDTGVGIPQEIIDQLFTPFFTTKPNGTGLGLAISGHIVTQHGGHIEVSSTPGQGSVFTVHLPIEGPAANS
jgi:Signal transduction histidine kinase regulating C4-dicarboxylate transport system